MSWALLTLAPICGRLCDKQQAFSLPTLMYYTPPEKKGFTYEGNKTEGELLKFATELAVISHPEERGRRYAKELEAITAMSVKEIKAR